jgi:hypothetical protein
MLSVVYAELSYFYIGKLRAIMISVIVPNVVILSVVEPEVMLKLNFSHFFSQNDNVLAAKLVPLPES